MGEMMPGETFDQFWERTSYSAQLKREEKARKRAQRQQVVRRLLGGLDRASGVSREKHLKVRDKESKLGITFGLVRTTRSHEEYK